VRRSLPSLILLIAISCGALFFRLGSLPLSGADEPRYARIAQEMRDRGSWTTPLLQGKPWLEKPPLYYWITAPFYSIVKTRETAARLGPSLCALIAAIAVFWLGCTLWSRQTGLIGASILLTSIGFAGFGRGASTDMPFTCCFTLAMAIACGAVLPRAQMPAYGRDGHASGWKILFAYVFLGLAVLGKGPVAIVLAFGIGLCFWFLDEQQVGIRGWRVVQGFALTAAVSVPWFWLAFRQNGFAFIATFFINHNIARYVTEIHHHSEPFLYYIPVLLALLFPWSGWLPLFLKSPLEEIRRWRRWDSRNLFLICWFLFPMVFFSFSDSKLAGYILPSLPPLALVLGVYVSRTIEGKIEKSRLRAAGALHLVFSATIAVAAPVFFQKNFGGNWEIGLLLGAVTLIPALFSLGFAVKGKCIWAFSATVLQSLLLIIFISLFAFPVLGAYYSTREIAYRALEVRQPGQPILTYRFFQHSLHYYTGYQVETQLDDRESLVQFAGKHPDFLVVTDVEGMKEISGVRELSASPMGEQGNLRLLRIRNSRMSNLEFRISNHRKVNPIVNLSDGLSSAPTFNSPKSPSRCSSPTSMLNPPPVSVAPPRDWLNL
jgi:4-amino-4-deoxy-L-arabinose transferase-like glycosyltransferase